MKKTLIALAVAASAAVSGSAMAWTANGTGGSVDLGGTLTPVEKVTPWEVKVGAAVNGLDGLIQKGQKEVSIAVNKAIPVLGVRTQDSGSFAAQSGIDPKINYNGAVDFSNMTGGVAKLKLNVHGAADEKIGTLEADILTGVGVARNTAAGGDAYSGYSDGLSFDGGIGKSAGEVVGSLGELMSRLGAIDSEIAAHFAQMDKPDVGAWRVPSFSEKSDVGGRYSVFYGSGIEEGKTIKITLDQAASGDAPIQWKASLPVTVTYA